MAPLKLARLGSLFLAFAFGIIGAGVGINAAVKSNDAKGEVQRAAEQFGATVKLDTSDVFASGAVVTAVCFLIAVISVFCTVIQLTTLGERRFLAAAQVVLLLFSTLWLFAALIPFDYFYANRSAGITAYTALGPVSASLLQTVERQLGLSSKYSDIDYLRLVAVLPWFAFLFAAISAAVIHAARRRPSEKV